jgi:cytochrome b6-f complex iron-sulfur subunit
MADSNQTSNGSSDEPRDSAENIAGNPAAGTRVPGAPLESVPSPAGATDQGGAPASHPADAHSEATPGASAPPPPGPATEGSANTPEQQSRVDELKAKIAALKAAKEGGVAVPAATAVAAAPATATVAAGGGDDAAKEAKLAEMRAKIEAAKAGKTATPASVAAPAAATAAAPAAKPAAAPAAPRPPAPKSPFAASATETKATDETGVWYFGRRNFMQSVGWMSFFGFFSLMLLGTLRAMFPRVIYEKPPVFKAGFPNDYVPGTVSELYKDEERVWIIRQTDGSFIGLLAICTHLGCTPRWLAAENKFKCPCHGSGFRGTPSWGVNFEGPAPRPLERVAIHLAPDGQIEIDKSKKFLWEKGQWEDPQATLKA